MTDHSACPRSDESTFGAKAHVQIRNAQRGDIDALLKLLKETHDIHVAGEPDVFEPLRRAEGKRAKLERDLVDSQASTLVAVDKEQIVGYLIVQEAMAPPQAGLRQRRFAKIEDFGVTRARRGEGIGRLLMQEAEFWARERHLETIELNVFAFNAGAIRLYEQLGFRTSSLRMRRTLKET